MSVSTYFDIIQWKRLLLFPSNEYSWFNCAGTRQSVKRPLRFVALEDYVKVDGKMDKNCSYESFESTYTAPSLH